MEWQNKFEVYEHFYELETSGYQLHVVTDGVFKIIKKVEDGNTCCNFHDGKNKHFNFRTGNEWRKNLFPAHNLSWEEVISLLTAKVFYI